MQTGARGSDSGDEDESLKVIEANILQGREIGLLGAISLIVNKIIGAGYHMATRVLMQSSILTLSQNILYSRHDLQAQRLSRHVSHNLDHWRYHIHMRCDGHARIWLGNATVWWNSDLSGKVFLSQAHADLRVPVLLFIFTSVSTTERYQW